MTDEQPTHRLRPDLLLFMAQRNLLHRKLRSGLTVAGVVIGVGAVFTLLSFGLGLQNLVTQDIVGSESIKTVDVQPASSKIISLDDANTDRFGELAHVERVGRSYNFASSITFEGSESDAVAFGMDQTFLDLSNLSIIAGQVFDPEAQQDTIIINSSALLTIGVDDFAGAIGKTLLVTIPFGGEKEDIVKELKIGGVIDSGSGSEIFMSYQNFRQAGVGTYSQVKLVVDDRENIPSVRAGVEASGFDTSSPVDTLDEVNLVFKFFNIILVSFGSIGLIVAVLGMFNTLTISLLERTQEVGLMMSHGARPKDIRNVFIVEAILISQAGALVGIVTSYLIGRTANFVLNQVARSRSAVESFDIFSTPLWLILITLLTSALIGYLVVYYPARRASKINPIDALRHE